jgi:hypothetical protein
MVPGFSATTSQLNLCACGISSAEMGTGEVRSLRIERAVGFGVRNQIGQEQTDGYRLRTKALRQICRRLMLGHRYKGDEVSLAVRGRRSEGH